MNFQFEMPSCFFYIGTFALLLAILKSCALDKSQITKPGSGILIPLSLQRLARGGSVFLVLFNILLMLYLKVPPRQLEFLPFLPF